MWSDCVTIYRETICDVERIVADGCHFEEKMEGRADITGTRQVLSGLLLAPAQVSLRAGDRVCRGVGPEKPDGGCARISRVRPFFLDGRLHHWEAEAV